MYIILSVRHTYVKCNSNMEPGETTKGLWLSVCVPQSLNELLETADAPFEVIAGFIQTISLTVPWAALLQENCALEVKGLEVVLRPRPRVGKMIMLYLGGC